MRLFDLLEASPMDNPAFLRWFAGSKVVDHRGNPLPVHHGTAIPKTAFRASRADNMHGIYFTPDLTAAHDHANMDAEVDGDDPLVYSVFLSIQNPLIVRSGVVDDPRVKLNNLGQPTPWVGQMDYQQLTTEMLNLLLQDGYDGIVITNGPVEDASEIVAFHPTQIKSVDNRGTWNPGSAVMNEGIESDPKFRAWFGDSDIKNPDGSPKVMYHWGPKGITKFRGMPTSNFLIYWNADSFSAKVAARNEEHEYRAYIRCENPYGTPQRLLHWGEAEEKADKIRQAGYDGIWVKDEGDASLAVFESDQIWLINSVQESFSKRTARYEGETEDQGDENY